MAAFAVGDKTDLAQTQSLRLGVETQRYQMNTAKIGRDVERRPDTLVALDQTAGDVLFVRSRGHQLHGVDPAGLSQAIDTSDPLLETNRRPWDFQVHHEPAPMMQVQPFARRVSSKEQPRTCSGE